MERSIIEKELNKELYPDYMIDQTISKLESLTPDIKQAFEGWLSSGTIPKIIIEGFSYDSLVNDYQKKPIGAFLALDWLVREPQIAKQSLMRAER